MARKKNSRKFRNNKTSLTTIAPQQQGKFNFQYHTALLEQGGREGINSLDPHNNFNTSLNRRCKGDRLTADELIKISSSLLIDSAIEKISNIVCRMQWGIKPPDDMDEELGMEESKKIAKCLKKPNYTEEGSYTMFIKSVIKNLLIFNIAPIQRQVGNEDRSFWLWAESPQYFIRNPRFKPEISGIECKYFFMPHNTQDRNKWVKIFEENMFLVKSKVATFEKNPRSAVEVAYDAINDWLGISEFQRRSTNKAIKDYLISLDEELSDSEIRKIRTWWRNDVEGSGEIPIFGGKISVHKFGAKGDADLYLMFKDHIAGLVALAFGLHQKDFNVEQKSGDNRATANVTADQSFQNAMLPLADCIADFLNNEVVDKYREGFEYYLSDREPRGEAAEIEASTKLFTDGLSTRNESRMKVGLGVIEGGDKFIDGTGIDGEEEEPSQEPVKPKGDKDEDEEE